MPLGSSTDSMPLSGTLAAAARRLLLAVVLVAVAGLRWPPDAACSGGLGQKDSNPLRPRFLVALSDLRFGPFRPQTGDTDCGRATLANLYLLFELNTTPDVPETASLLELAEDASRIGCDSAVFISDTTVLSEIVRETGAPVVIVCVLPSPHYALIVWFNDEGSAILVDPMTGIEWCSNRDLQRIYAGAFLLVDPPEAAKVAAAGNIRLLVRELDTIRESLGYASPSALLWRCIP